MFELLIIVIGHLLTWDLFLYFRQIRALTKPCLRDRCLLWGDRWVFCFKLIVLCLCFLPFSLSPLSALFFVLSFYILPCSSSSYMPHFHFTCLLCNHVNIEIVSFSNRNRLHFIHTLKNNQYTSTQNEKLWLILFICTAQFLYFIHESCLSAGFEPDTGVEGREEPHPAGANAPGGSRAQPFRWPRTRSHSGQRIHTNLPLQAAIFLLLVVRKEWRWERRRGFCNGSLLSGSRSWTGEGWHRGTGSEMIPLETADICLD